MALLFKCSGEIRLISPSNGVEFTVEEIRKYLNYSVVMYLGYGIRILFDKEGKEKGFAYNHEANELFGKIAEMEFLGDVLACKGLEFNYEDLEEEDLQDDW